MPSVGPLHKDNHQGWNTPKNVRVVQPICRNVGFGYLCGWNKDGLDGRNCKNGGLIGGKNKKDFGCPPKTRDVVMSYLEMTPKVRKR